MWLAAWRAEIARPLLPAPAVRGRPRRWPLRELVDGVRFRVRVGCPWRDVPQRYGPWWRVYALFSCWQLLGIWRHLEQALLAAADAADAAGKVTWQVSVDSTTARAHVHAAGARRDSGNRHEAEPEDHALGRSRGGWSTKIHLACEQNRQVMAFLLTAGQAGDSPQMIPVLQRIRIPRPGPGRPRTRDRVLGDRAYSSRANRAYLAGRGIQATIPDPSWDLAWSVATENARIYEGDTDEVLPADDQEWRLEAPPGGTVKYQVVFDMPAELVNGATLTVEAWRSIDEEFGDFL